MIRPVRNCSLPSDGISTTQKFLSSARSVLFSVPCATTNHVTLKFKDLSSKSDWESIAGSQCQLAHALEAAAGTHSYAGPFLNSNRQWRSVYSEVGAVLGAVGPTLAMDAGAAESEGFKFDAFRGAKEGFNADLLREQTEGLRQEILSGDFEVKPTTYTPVQGSEAVQFYVTCALLFVAFWVGNYLAPDLIFKDTVFRNGNGEGNDYKKDDFAGDIEQVVDSEQRQGPPGDPVQSVDSRTGSMNKEDVQTEKLVVGFGKSSGRTPKKPRRSS